MTFPALSGMLIRPSSRAGSRRTSDLRHPRQQRSVYRFEGQAHADRVPSLPQPKGQEEFGEGKFIFFMRSNHLSWYTVPGSTRSAKGRVRLHYQIGEEAVT